MLKLGLACAFLLACAPAFAAGKPSPTAAARPANATIQANTLALVFNLAARPSALVEGNRCEIRGAVWANGPRPGVNVELLDGTHTYKARTNAHGVYALSIPFAGSDIALMERPADPIFIRKELADKGQVFKPTFVCSQKLTAQIKAQSKRSN